MRVAVQRVNKCFGATQALNDVSLDIPDGELFFLLGPSGCGKTTLLRIIAGFIHPDTGSVLFDGQPIDALPPHKRDAAMVFQNYALWPHMTVAENVAFGLTVPSRQLARSEREQRVRTILEPMQIKDLAQRTPAQLSGGQQQRVALARAMVVQPSCLLLDEPLSNLDAKLRQAMRVEIRRLIKTVGITAIYVTHDQEEALSMADSCAVLHNGSVMQVDTPAQLYTCPQNPFVADFIGGANLFAGTVLNTTPHGSLKVTADIPEPDADTIKQNIWHGRQLEGHAPATKGAPVTICVRPEAIQFQTSASPHNTFTGKIQEVFYYGRITEYWVAWRGAIKLRVVVNNTAAPALNLQPGADAQFYVDPYDVLVLNAAPGLPGI